MAENALLTLLPASPSNNTSTYAFSACNFSATRISYSSCRRSFKIKKGPICQLSSGEVTCILPMQTAKSKDELIRALKLKLLNVVSGLNRGLAASDDDLRKAKAAAKELESAGGVVDLSADLEKLQGRWKLIYSSDFSTRTLAGSPSEPPIARALPITLGQVFQRIDVFSKDFDNIVELEFGAPWPLPPIQMTETLAHKFELIGTSQIKIISEKTTVKITGNLSHLPQLDVPRIPDAGSSELEVTYLDSSTRITRGDMGELRVFIVS